MNYTVYILESVQSGHFYKGYTSDIEKRLWEHNNGLSRYTRNKGPWKLVFEKKFENKSEALLFEKRIKRFNSNSLQNLINSYYQDK
ncbi:MAG: GIY-YIG nuclease family protein [Bacteroidales bacterium]|nr:GIY-YIG nuclease family protein [Bacteroidales bacterium]